MVHLAPRILRPTFVALGSILVLGLLHLGCFGLIEHSPNLIEDDQSPAAPYLDELWRLPDARWDRSIRDGLSPDGEYRLVVEHKSVELMRGQDRVMRLRRCTFDVTPDPMIVASWSSDAKAVLIETDHSYHLQDLYDLGEGCGHGPSRLIFLIDPGGFWHVRPFEGTRSEALQVAASESDALALPALGTFSGRFLEPAEVEQLVPVWAGAGQSRKHFLTRPMLGGHVCSGADSVVERLLTHEALPPDLRDALIDQVVQRLADGDGTMCLRIPRLTELLALQADDDTSFARLLVEHIDGYSGKEAARLRRRFADRPTSPLPPRPAPDRLLTTDAHGFTYLTVDEAEARWIQEAVARLPFPIAKQDLRERIGLPMELLEPETLNYHGSYPKTIRTIRHLRRGFTLYTFYATADQIELAEVLEYEQAVDNDRRQPAIMFPSRDEALAILVEDNAPGSSLAADLPRCDDVFEGLFGGRLECYQPTPYKTILIQVLDDGVRAAARRTIGRSISSVDVGPQRFVLLVEAFPRVGLSLLAETEGVLWPLVLDGDVSHGTGTLQLVDGEIEIRFRGERLAMLALDSLTLRRTDGSIDCGRVRDPNRPILLRELRRDETDLCTRLAAASVGRMDVEVLRDAVRSDDWTTRGPGLVASWRRGSVPLPAANEAMRELTDARARSILRRLCAETMIWDLSRHEEGIAWIRELADAADLDLPSGCA